MDVKEWLPPGIRGSAIERKLAAGQVLFSRGDRAAGLYEVLNGKVRRARLDSEGRELVLGFARAGDTLAEASLFSPIHHCTAVAMATTVVRFYRKAVVLAELARNPQAAQSFAERLAHQVLELRARLELRNIYSARDRVRHYLAAGAEGDTVVLPGSVKDLAGELGLTHEALYRTLSEMEGAGEIARHKGKIRLARDLYDRVHF
jgi:CRP-like cAMP-binding protein